MRTFFALKKVRKLQSIKEAYLRTRSVEEDDNYDQEREMENSSSNDSDEEDIIDFWIFWIWQIWVINTTMAFSN